MEKSKLLLSTFDMACIILAILQTPTLIWFNGVTESMLTLSPRMDLFLLTLGWFLYYQAYNPLMTPSYQTPQEAAVARLLDSLPLRYRYRWVLRNRPYANYVFDFFIQGGLILECSATKNASSKAVNWLYQKAGLVNRRFWVVKRRFNPPPITVFLFEAPRAHPNRIHNAIQTMTNFGELASTDRIFVHFSELETFLTKWSSREDINPI
ncbi:MAG: hypothetical protein ACE5R6_04510 [Candidatus Heimdallarchaeota archaeon]